MNKLIGQRFFIVFCAMRICILALFSGVLDFCWSRRRNSLPYELLNYVMTQFLLICCQGVPREHDPKKLFVTNLPCFVILVIQDPSLCRRVRGRRTLWAWRGFVIRTFWFEGKQLTVEGKNRNTATTSDLGYVVRNVDDAIHRINYYPVDSVVCFVNTYPLTSDLSCG